MQNGTGMEIEITKTQIRKAVKQGGALWSSLIPLARMALPSIGKTLSLSALSGFASEGAN